MVVGVLMLLGGEEAVMEGDCLVELVVGGSSSIQSSVMVRLI